MRMVGTRATRLTLALAFTALAAPGVMAQQSEAADAETTLSCSMLENEAPQAPVAWLTYSLWASHCYSFQARAVAIDTFNVRTLALSHRIKDGVRQQVVQHLDGPSVNVERRAPVGHWGWLDASASADPAPMPERWAEHVASVYDITLEADKRVADRDAVQLTFMPKQGDRYRHQWWLDQKTGLLLKHVLRDADDAILETFQVTRLQTPERYPDDVVVARPDSVDEPDWQVGWLPEGMEPQPGAARQASRGRTQRFYSDGLATVSLFVESPVVSTALSTGVHKLGVSAIAVERHTAPASWQVIAIGEVPPELLGRIARSVTYTEK
ncbi:sigma E regulatory protein, MucB/RseB [Vreelandella subglaciescola]|uniref:Sigma E regulatory protein, MucB/RseB n=2 Tax=Vreelandella subglaciescola TaxID=29571 RepID=A0A1M7EYN6_9GAMM|nr:sigma E regulatory protein, MucB/RseB [Halomonas subglaciescola]